MPGGTLVASSILLAEKTGAGTPTLTSTLTQGGGSVSTGTLTFGLDAGGGATARLLPTYNLNGGTLRAATLTAGGGAFASNSSRNLNLAGGTLTHSVGSDLTLTGLDTSLAGRLNLNVSAASVISADAGRTVTIGDHALLSGVAALTKSGDGTLRILSDASGYTGAMTVSAGTIGGTTTLGGSLNVSAGATLSPGASVGTFGVNGALTLASNATLRIEIDSDTAYDQLIAAGTVDLAGAQLQLVSPTNYFSPGGGGENVAGLSYTILNKTSSGAVSGTLFLGMTELVQGAQFSSAGTLWSIDYFGGDGNDIVLTSVPEPSMLGVLGLATLTLQRRRRSCPADPITS
ncbi:MAG TPA: autotransporter-associated beta strand repeat-containing protein [Lacipirellulaceae bacterium]|nr:autotransporter-associated beta strand repeat-containing protein [Lacipirellulaceae bacterium]